MKRITTPLAAAVAAFFCVSGCLTPKYDKIPLERNEIPYILADGDYTDVNGNVHSNQHNVWAMQEADVYDYVRGLAPSTKRGGVMERIKSIGSIDKSTFFMGGFAFIAAFLGIKLFRLKRKLESQQIVPDTSDEEED